MAQLPEPVTLPVSGRQVAFRRVKGLDYVEAERIAGDRNSIKYAYAMLARRIEATPAIVMEDILDMDEDDIAILMDTLNPFLMGTKPSMPKDSSF